MSITGQFSVNRLSVTCQSTCQSLCQSPVNDRTTHLSVISCQLTVNLLSNLSIIYHFGNRLSKSFCQSPVKCMSTTCHLPAQSFSNHLTTTRHSPVNHLSIIVGGRLSGAVTHLSVTCQSSCHMSLKSPSFCHSPVTHLSITGQSSWVVGGLALSIVVSLGEYMTKKPADQHDNKVPTFTASS